MITTAAGPNGVYAANTEVDVPYEQAVEWIQAGYAAPVHTAAETATVEAPEQAVKPARVRARRKRGDE